MTKKNTQLLLEALPIVLILITLVVGVVLYPRLPESVPSHWGISGDVDSLMSKNMSVILFPLLTLVVYILMTIAPIFDPLRENFSKFVVPYFWFRTVTVFFLCLLYFYSLWVALGAELNIVYFIVPVSALYFVLLGFFFPKVKRNYFVGIRTPWTLHSDKVWDMTHVFGEKVFVGTGVLSLFSVLVPNYSFLVFISLILLASCSVSVYSYYAFKEVEKMPKSKRK
jgi:uncharacterized membrane protein